MELFEIITLSLRVSLTATVIGFIIALPLAAFIASHNFKGKQAVIIVVNALQSLPSVLIGLMLYLALSKQGILGGLNWLFTPKAMILAQTLLTFPIVLALGIRLFEPLYSEFQDALKIDGAPAFKRFTTLSSLAKFSLTTLFFTAFGRAIAEVGAIMIVGGNIRGHTRTMTTTIALETSKGDFNSSLILGSVLLLVSLTLSTIAVYLVERKKI